MTNGWEFFQAGGSAVSNCSFKLKGDELQKCVINAAQERERERESRVLIPNLLAPFNEPAHPLECLMSL